jgi:hypothetical protein
MCRRGGLPPRDPCGRPAATAQNAFLSSRLWVLRPSSVPRPHRQFTGITRHEVMDGIYLYDSWSCRGEEEGRKTPPYVISHRESKTHKLCNTGNGGYLFPVAPLFSSNIFSVAERGPPRRDSALRLSARRLAHCSLLGPYVPPIDGQGQAAVPTQGAVFSPH